ncbi:MAG: hypothetical protein Q4B76_03590 [bacterium]|nr:hypothetical protein [bacterium]
MFADDTNIEKMGEKRESREDGENHNPYFDEDAWSNLESDMRQDPESAMFVAMEPDQAPRAEQGTEAGEDDPTERKIELEPEEIDENGEITQAAFDKYREEAHQMFIDIPDIEHVILINRETGDIVADFQPSNIDTITRETATEDPQEMNLLDNRSNADVLTGNRELSAEKSAKDLLEDDEGDIPDNMRTGKDITASSTDASPLGPTNNAVAEAIAVTAGNTDTASTVDIGQVVDQLHHDGLNDQAIATEADELMSSVDAKDLDAGGITSLNTTKEDIKKQKDIASNAAIASATAAVKGIAKNNSGQHEEALEAADKATSFASAAETAVESIPALGGDNDIATRSSDMRTRQAEQLAKGAASVADQVVEAANNALAEPAVPTDENGIPLTVPEHDPTNIQISANSENPQDDYFNMLQAKMQAEQADAANKERAAKMRIQEAANGTDAPHINGAITS